MSIIELFYFLYYGVPIVRFANVGLIVSFIPKTRKTGKSYILGEYGMFGNLQYTTVSEVLFAVHNVALCVL